MRPKLYLAGPTVFMPNAKQRGEALKAICTEHGCDGLFPLDHGFVLPEDANAAMRMIFASCGDMLRRADAVIADLSPFRGPHCDDGTAVEIGMAIERGIPVFGYSNDLRPLVERIPFNLDTHGARRCDSGAEVEDFGQPFNLMIAGAIEAVFGTPEETIAAAAAHLRRRPPA
jgi:nucleoside 2-deoxyribosyltransferase